MACSTNYFSGNTGSNYNQKFDDPFLLPSSEIIPEDLSNALDLCKFLYYLNPIYRGASRRVIRHFITKFKFGDAGDTEEKNDFKDYLTYTLKLEETLNEAGDEFSIYGNAFFRIHFPFTRYLMDTRDGKTVFHTLNTFPTKDVKFFLNDMVYEVPDPRNNFKTRIKLPFVDHPLKSREHIKIVKLDPRRITILHNFISKSSTYIYSFEDFFVNDVKEGVLYQVNETPKSMLEAISKDQSYQFKSNAIFHFKAPVPSGMSDYGWGFPETMANFRSIYQSQIYRKVDEIIGLDYLLPFNIKSSEPKVSVSQPKIY